MGGFGDGMKMGDGFQMKLDCGHPHKKPGEKCELCGKVVPGEKKEEAETSTSGTTKDKELGDGTS
jgi:hypothetical protein